jgi:hypothetical protein
MERRGERDDQQLGRIRRKKMERRKGHVRGKVDCDFCSDKIG